jgi:4'-phosphopantetheinyl transferase
MTRPASLWQIPAAPVSLPLDTVHVWRADLDVAPETLRSLQDTLSTDEQVRAAKFCASIDRNRYAAGRGILRALLAQYLGTPAGTLQFCLNPHGKPSLMPAGEIQSLRFNVSHSRGLALFAFAFRRDVGVDVEYLRAFDRMDRLAEQYFSAQEITALRALPISDRIEAFFRCWTRKEAYIKARGRGLSISLASFTVSLAPEELSNLPITSEEDPEAGRWSVRGLNAGSGYAGAVVAEGADWSPVLWQWT